MKDPKEFIKELIKPKIISQIIGIKIPHRGLEKRFIKYNGWSHLGYNFIPDFEPASLLVDKQITISVHFKVKGILELGLYSSVESFGAYFGPIKVFIENSTYQIDCLNAYFYQFESE